MTDSDYYLRLRIPDPVRRQLLKAAGDNNRSMTAEILTRLQWSLETTPAPLVESEALDGMLDRLSLLETQFEQHLSGNGAATQSGAQ